MVNGRLFRSLIAALAAVAAATCLAADNEQKFVKIGDLKLESGKVLKDVRVGYRTFGKLNAAKDNVILFPTWYLGKSADLAGQFGPNGYVDTSRYFGIAVDALGNSVSTSPSNSKAQPNGKFPAITIGDMVHSQHALLQKLGIRHLKAVIGISMGGMQTFEWVTAYPGFVDFAIPIVGSPRASSYDLMFYRSCQRAMELAIRKPQVKQEAIRIYADFFDIALHTPGWSVQHTRREATAKELAGFEGALAKWNVYDMSVGMAALIRNDVYRHVGVARAIARVRAKMLIVVAAQDHCVNPAPALNFAKLLGAETIILPDNDGHQSPGVEGNVIVPAIRRLLGD